MCIGSYLVFTFFRSSYAVAVMFSHYELQLLLDRNQHLNEATTQIDFLQVFAPSRHGPSRTTWSQQLDDNTILPHLEQEPFIKPTLRIFFLKSSPDIESSFSTNNIQVRLDTLRRLSTCFKISPLFLESVLHPSPWAKPGRACFLLGQDEQRPLSIECFDRMLNGWNVPSYIWLSHALETGSSTYLLVDCPERVKSYIVRRAHDDAVMLASCPFTVEALMARECCDSWRRAVDFLRGQLLHWEDSGGQGIPLGQLVHRPDATKTLHDLSRSFQIINGDLTDLDESLVVLIDFARRCKSLTSTELGLSYAAIDTLDHLTSRNRICRRWAENYHERTKLIMNLFFSMGSQLDSRTNLEIANLTSKIARDAQRDSSSMITIAAVTMVFLPGTFISAVFSMAFFNAGTDENGKATLEVSPLVWYFPAVTVPLTILVFGVWEFWRRKRQAKVTPVAKQPGDKESSD
ncbi:MAG: hypothetical protein LQ339_003932 [Xanthoria mediterranea]|nr:MAG: hypothetical protein LQ339_003932 [Xanthoria mediterranea]